MAGTISACAWRGRSLTRGRWGSWIDICSIEYEDNVTNRRGKSVMSPYDLSAELKKEPFQPFRIVTTTGKTYDIMQNDRPFLLVSNTSVIIGLRVGETSPFFDRYEVVSLDHIVRLEP